MSADSLHRERGADSLDAERGADSLHRERGADSLDAERGADSLHRERGADSLDAERGADSLHREHGADSLDAERGADSLHREHGADSLDAERGADSLHRERGRDSPGARDHRSYDYDARRFDSAVALAVSGLDYLRGVLRGDYPAAPIAATLGFAPVEFEPGRAVFEGKPERFVYNPIGAVHGGWAATLLDSAMGCAVHSTLPAGKAYTTVDLSISLVRAITDRAGHVRCEATVIHSGSSIATAEGRIIGSDGTLYAHGTTTCLILTPR